MIAASRSSPVPSGMPYTRENMRGWIMRTEDIMLPSTVKSIAVGTTSLASAMGRSPSTLGSTTTIVGDAPISGTASEIIAIDATANQDATAKVRFVGLGYVNFIFSLYD